jgi:hypothetical protein
MVVRVQLKMLVEEVCKEAFPHLGFRIEAYLGEAHGWVDVKTLCSSQSGVIEMYDANHQRIDIPVLQGMWSSP